MTASRWFVYVDHPTDVDRTTGRPYSMMADYPKEFASHEEAEEDATTVEALLRVLGQQSLAIDPGHRVIVPRVSVRVRLPMVKALPENRLKSRCSGAMGDCEYYASGPDGLCDVCRGRDR